MEAELTSPARNPSTKMIPNMDQGLMKKTQSVKTEFGIPMRIFVRKSKRPNLYAEELFRIVREGVRFYEEFIGVQYPWQKYDQIFCPEYRIGAMENVGAITFTDNYL